MNGHAEVVRDLLAHGASIDDSGRQVMTSRCHAAQNRHTEGVRVLSESFANVNRQKWKHPAVVRCSQRKCGRGDGTAEELSLLRRSRNADVTDNVGATPLLAAPRNGRVEVVCKLLQSSASVTNADKNWTTPLLAAVQNNHVEAVTLLLQGSANANVVDCNGNSASVDLVNYTGETPLLVAAGNGHAEAVSILLKNSTSVGKANKKGIIPLLAATQNGDVDVMSMLLGNNANPGGREALQVELHGNYSVERMRNFKHYLDTSSGTRVMVFMTATPLSCLLAAIGPDLIPLEPPETGLKHSHLSPDRVRVTGHEHWNRGMSVRLGILDGVPVAIYVTCMWSVRVCAHGRHDGSGVAETLRSGPRTGERAYTFAFNKLSGWPQAVFALLLPAMEIAVKNGMSYLVYGQEDVRSEFIILNTEAFHALFVATCLQGSTYIATTAILVAADFLHACLSLRDVNAIVEEIRESLGNERRDENDERNGQAAVNSMSSPRTLHYIEAAMFLLENHDHLHCEPHTHSLTVFVAFT
ncbi:Ankyrin 2, partial [Globisporangium splendens]